MLGEPYALAEQDVRVTAAIGTASTDDHATRPEQLIRDADEAMLRAKVATRRRGTTRAAR